MRGMDYAEARAAFFHPRDAAPADDSAASRGRRLRHAIEPIATVHYWSEPANTDYAEVGLDFLTGYVWSRACVLGEPDAAVVASAFGVFEPGMIASVYASARSACSLGDIRGAREAGAVSALRTCLGETAVTAVLDALRRGLTAADPTGRVLYAGLAEPTDEYAQLWHACGLLREYRGDCHLAACVAAGLTGLQANLLTEMQVGWEARAYTSTRGWSPEAMDVATAELQARGLVADNMLTDAGHALRTGIEEQTDSLVTPVLDLIGDDVDDVVAAAMSWSQQIIDHGWFPPDPYKRASG